MATAEYGLGCLKVRDGRVSCCWHLQVYIWAPIYNEDWSAFAPDFKVGSLVGMGLGEGKHIEGSSV